MSLTYDPGDETIAVRFSGECLRIRPWPHGPRPASTTATDVCGFFCALSLATGLLPKLTVV